MNEEQKNEIKQVVEHMKALVADVENMLKDHDACVSETSKKYIGAAILKMAQQIGWQAR